MDSVVLIPAYNPGEPLLSTVDSIIRLGIKHVIVVDDGSKEECRHIFNRLDALENCHVLRHAVNLGKGRALKTGFNYFLMNFKDSSAGVVTADADGQHLPEDILKVASTLEANPGCLVLGARKFDREVPMRSLIGNTLTRYIFFFLVGKKISDTQTGLRGLPASFLPHLIKLDGEGYEYEMNMLVSTKTRHIGIVEQEIATVYLENNRLSHFNPFLDSMKIYFLLLRFALSSAATSLLDFIVFAISFQSTRNILASMALARFVSVNINFIVNRNLVFHNKNAYSFIIVKFYVAAIIMGTLSYVIIKDLSQYMGVNVILAKVATESVLFLFSFMLQRDLIFTSSPLAGEGPSRLSERA